MGPRRIELRSPPCEGDVLPLDYEPIRLKIVKDDIDTIIYIGGTLTRYYTGSGDDGTTGIISGRRVGKSDILIGAIGDLDELNSAIGIAVANLEDMPVRKQLETVQNAIFIIGAELASAGGSNAPKARITGKSVEELEACIKELGGSLPELKQFVLPGGSVPAALLHHSRAIARRAERSVVAASKTYAIDMHIVSYLNRLSSYLFTAALYINFKNNFKEANPHY